MPTMPRESDAVEWFSARRMYCGLLPLSVSGRVEERNADELSPSSRSALRFATRVLEATEKGAPAAANAGAPEKVCAAEKVWGEFRRATLAANRASGSVPDDKFAAFV